MESKSLVQKLTQQLMNDEEIMKRKLMIDGDGVGDDRKISNLIKQLVLWCYYNNESDLESEQAAERLLIAINQSELAIAKSLLTTKMITDELINYENLYRNIEKAIKDAKEKLNNCKMELALAKQLRHYKLDYDSVANIIEKHPSTQETQQKLNVLEAEIQRLQMINNLIESKVEKRRRQFQLLLSASHQLLGVLDEENQNQSQNTMSEQSRASPAAPSTTQPMEM